MKCLSGYERIPNTIEGTKGSCRKSTPISSKRKPRKKSKSVNYRTSRNSPIKKKRRSRNSPIKKKRRSRNSIVKKKRRSRTNPIKKKRRSRNSIVKKRRSRTSIVKKKRTKSKKKYKRVKKKTQISEKEYLSFQNSGQFKDGPATFPQTSESNIDSELLDENERLKEKLNAYAQAMKKGGIKICGDPDNPYFGIPWQKLVEMRETIVKNINEAIQKGDEVEQEKIAKDWEQLEAVLNIDKGYIDDKAEKKRQFFESHETDIIRDYNILRGYITPEMEKPSENNLKKAFKIATEKEYLNELENQSISSSEAEELAKIKYSNNSKQINKLIKRIRLGTNVALTWVRRDKSYIANLSFPDLAKALSRTGQWSLNELRAIYHSLPPDGFQQDPDNKKAELLETFLNVFEAKLKNANEKDDWNSAYYINPNDKEEGLLVQPFKDDNRNIDSNLTIGESPEVLMKKAARQNAENLRKAGDDRYNKAIKTVDKDKKFQYFDNAKKQYYKGIEELEETEEETV